MRKQFMKFETCLKNDENDCFRKFKIISQNHKSQAAADRCSIKKLFRNVFVLLNNC